MAIVTARRAAAGLGLLAITATAASGQLHHSLELRQPLEVPAVSAAAVLGTTRTDKSVTVRLLNVGAQPIVAVQVVVGESLADEGHLWFMGVASVSPIDWLPGAEQHVTIWTEGLSDSPEARVRAVVLADGTGEGDVRVVRGFHQRFADLHDGAVRVLRLLGPATPASEEALQLLIDRIGTDMASAPAEPDRPEHSASHEEATRFLRRLQGRDLTSTARMDRELASLRSRLEATRDAAARFPFARRGW